MNKSFIIDSSSIDMRIDRWIKNTIGNVPQSLIEKSLRNGKIKLNNKKVKSSTKLSESDKIYFYNFQFIESKKKKYKFKPSNQIIKENEEDIIDNNDDFIVINKAPGIVVHPGSGNRSGTILNSLLFNFPELADLPRAGIIHRLDKDTSGLIVVAKDNFSHEILFENYEFQSANIKFFEALKTYLSTYYEDEYKFKNQSIDIYLDDFSNQINSSKKTDLELMSSLIPEDILILVPESKNYILRSAAVFSPSNWDLKSKINKSLDIIHEPVPGYEKTLSTKVNSFLNRLPASRIFERFYRGDGLRSDQHNGLGLAIVKHIVDLHKGTIEASSEINEGLKIMINFPQ